MPRVRFFYDRLGEALLTVAGIRLHQGKTRVWNKSQLQPTNVEDLGPDVWQPRGISVLGTPIGSEDYVREKMIRRVEEERRLSVPDLQCDWQLLLQSANPRANHRLRTMPPSQSAEYARAHDEGTWQVVTTLLDLDERGDHDPARQVASLPMRMGGHFLRSASRGAQKPHVGPHRQIKITLFSMNESAFPMWYFFPKQVPSMLFRTVFPTRALRVGVRTSFVQEEQQDF